MALRDVLTWPNARLLELAADVPRVDAEVQQLIDDLFETMRAQEGVGLAATQVGVPWRVVVLDCGGDTPDPLALVNARIVAREGTIVWREGCLSLPGVTAEVERSAQITVEYLNREGEACTREAKGLTAVCIQHELDHLEGQLYVDRLGALERKATLLAYDDARGEAERFAEATAADASAPA
jgi:peptide deformylase